MKTEPLLTELPLRLRDLSEVAEADRPAYAPAPGGGFAMLPWLAELRTEHAGRLAVLDAVFAEAEAELSRVRREKAAAVCGPALRAALSAAGVATAFLPAAEALFGQQHRVELVDDGTPAAVTDLGPVPLDYAARQWVAGGAAAGLLADPPVADHWVAALRRLH